MKRRVNVAAGEAEMWIAPMKKRCVSLVLPQGPGDRCDRGEWAGVRLVSVPIIQGKNRRRPRKGI
jgi:hypothetical protein